MGPRTVIYNRPQIDLLRGPDAYVRLISTESVPCVLASIGAQAE